MAEEYEQIYFCYKKQQPLRECDTDWKLHPTLCKVVNEIAGCISMTGRAEYVDRHVYLEGEKEKPFPMHGIILVRGVHKDGTLCNDPECCTNGAFATPYHEDFKSADSWLKSRLSVKNGTVYLLSGSAGGDFHFGEIDVLLREKVLFQPTDSILRPSQYNNFLSVEEIVPVKR
jgi:hypothetical protein